jgi:hypothetical protein
MMISQEKLYKPIVKNGDYLFRDVFAFEYPVEIHFTRIEDFDNPNAFKVLVLSNESYLSPNRANIESVIKNKSKYDLILCSDTDILNHCCNSVLFPYGSTWLNRGSIEHPDGLGLYDKNCPAFSPPSKKFGVSFLASWYNIDRPGYKIRHDIWENQNKITIPKFFYTSVKSFSSTPNPLPNGEKESLFESLYHICIENQSVENYFTEKIIDSFLTETIPIYWGCPNIGKYFNPDGIIFFRSIDDLIEKINNLTPDYYYDRLNIVHENKKKAIELANFDERIHKKVIEHYAQRSSADKT